MLRRLLIALAARVPGRRRCRRCRRTPACTCQPREGPQSAAKRADGGVHRRSSTGPPDDAGRRARATYLRRRRSTRSTRASVDTADGRRSTRPRHGVRPRAGCRPDRRYVFFVDRDRRPRASTDRCSGTAPRDRRAGRARSSACSARAATHVAAAARAEAEFTTVADAEPETLTRLAAPGARAGAGRAARPAASCAALGRAADASPRGTSRPDSPGRGGCSASSPAALRPAGHARPAAAPRRICSNWARAAICWA